MKTQEFLDLLEMFPDHSLLFEYANGHFVPEGYHNTEVKNVTINAMDCGSHPAAWNETVLQLLDGRENKKEARPMTCRKATNILKAVHEKLPFSPEAELKLEYGNTVFHTTQLSIRRTTTSDQSLKISLGINPATCKPRMAGEAEDRVHVPSPGERRKTICC